MAEMQSRSFQLSDSDSLEVGFQDSRNMSGGSLAVLDGRGKCFGILTRLFILVRQKNTWSPFQILGELWRLLTNLDVRREILSVLKLRPFDKIVQNNPGLALKYVVPNYLARDFTVSERASCFLHHYRRMHAAFPEGVLREILQGDATLHEIVKNGNRFTVTIGLPEPIGHLEGELSLDLRVNGKKVLNLSFIIAPGWVIKSEAAEILFITRLQGTKECISQLRLVRKGLYEFSPRKLLLAALQGVAEALGISELGAVCAANQRCYGREYPTFLKSGYDDFFADVGMVKTAAGFYSSPVLIEGRPLASFKGRNRTRARKRRAMRQQIQAACTAFLLGAADQGADPSSGTLNSTPAPGPVESRLSPTSCPAPDQKIP